MRAASFDWEALLPILFFVLYGLAQFFGGRKGPEEEGGEVPEQSDAQERARQIREEIRRKIEARRKGSSGRQDEAARGHGQARPYDPTVPDSRQSQPKQTAQANDRKELSHQRKELSQPARKEARDPRQSKMKPEQKNADWRSPVPGPRPGEIGMEGPSMLERKLAEQRKRLEDSRREQEAAKEKSRKIREKAGIERGSVGSQGEATGVQKGVPAYGFDKGTVAGLRSAVIEGLRDPKKIRQAVLYREILDPPVGMR